MAEVALAYRLTGFGWAAFDLRIGEASIEVGTFSYLTDALGDLVRATLEIATGGYRADAVFDGEPVTWRLVLQRDWNSPHARSLHIAVDEFSDMAHVGETPGTALFAGSCDAEAFARVVADAVDAVWAEFGADGYNERWAALDHGFPLRALTALKAALATEEPSAPPPPAIDTLFVVTPGDPS